MAAANNFTMARISEQSFQIFTVLVVRIIVLGIHLMP